MTDTTKARPVVAALALGRSTFDVPHAEAMADAAFAALDRLDVEVVGPRELLFDAPATRTALAGLPPSLDLLLLIQATFTDAAMTQAIGAEIGAPLALWAFPEQRTGGRLRLNSFCGVNLAAHALTRTGRSFGWLYRAPDDPRVPTEITALLARGSAPRPPSRARPADPARFDGAALAHALEVKDRLASARIGVIGDHPAGFVPCEYDPGELAGLTGVVAERLELDDLFGRARAVPEWEAARVRTRVADLAGIDAVDQESLGRSLRLYPALKAIAAEHRFDGLAVRCWPECFTEYGGANCGPAALLNDELLPTACEADVYGNVTALALQWLSGSPALVADLVDVDVENGTGVLWHCGKAPLSMAGPQSVPAATIHSNRRQPLLHEFALKPGRVTLARLSQAGGAAGLVIGGGEMLDAPLPFSGTAGVVRFDRPAGDVVDTVMSEGLEHHYGLTYGDVRAELEALAGTWNIPVVDL